MATEGTSFAATTIADAVARHLRVDLVLKPVTAETPPRLISRFLAIQDDDTVVLEMPHDANRHRVFVPVGWQLGMSFELGDLWVQAVSTVCGHDLFPLHPTRRIDALLVVRPNTIASCNRRRSPRLPVNDQAPVAAMFWPENADITVAAGAAGRVRNWSDNGLAVELPANPRIQAGADVVVRLEASGARECLILRGRFKHCTRQDDGTWLAGMGDLAEIQPGESPKLMEYLSASQRPRAGH